jgi:hypothetical protein
MEFPVETLFMKEASSQSYSFVDDGFKTVERIGGTLSHLENENHLKL